MDFWGVAAEWWVKWLFGIIAGILIAGFRNLYKRQKAMEDGVQAILRDRIVASYYHYHERQNITLHGLENVKHMYSSYHALGGNGAVTKLVEDLEQLEVVDE